MALSWYRHRVDFIAARVKHSYIHRKITLVSTAMLTDTRQLKYIRALTDGMTPVRKFEFHPKAW